MLSPNNEQSFASTGSSISFSGYYPAAGETLYVVAGPSPNGPWSVMGTTQTANNALTLPSGVKVYGFSTSRTLPPSAWSAASCTENETYVYVSAGNAKLANAIHAFDHESVSGVHPVTCLSQNNYNPSPCAADSSPIARLRAPGQNGPTAHVGNVTIDSKADLIQWGCLETLDGNLTISDGLQEDLTVPNLQSITGNLSITYPRYAPNLPFIDEGYARALPALTTIGGGFTATTPDNGGNYMNLDVGLNAVTSIGGDIHISTVAFNTDIDGLTALAAAPGNVRVDAGSGDFTGNIFSNLLTVGGDLHLSLGHNTFAFVMTNLTTVNGDFLMDDGNPSSGVLSALATVGGDFTVQNLSIQGIDQVFAALSSVGGRLTVDNLQNFTTWRLGAGPMVSTAFTLQNTSGLSAIGAGDVDVIGNGSIQILNNPNLCTSTAQTYVDSLVGWTGTSQIAGNGGC